MESDCRICRRIIACCTLLWCLLSFSVLGVSALSKESTSTLDPMATPCWQVEEFVVSAECFQCNAFQLRSWPVCNPTGYVEKINCGKSKKDEYKSCRSVAVEEGLFWKFEGTVLCLTVVFALLVILRQRALDRRASEKVRRQLESV
ncbi:protein JTB-like isoform X1 [Brienomyrus brachyistius]|uniref:protein JTB-like isoform X1 n=2 Tax=Brienomyrus brachyistius TaxID=42636 RepID=UPI0020B23143|nr:protein JTB-like isoform X1 [Brienomyrus brachyistius]